jgi:hypothetical protein
MADEPAKIILGDTAITGIEQTGRRRFFRRKDRQGPPLIHCENCGVLLTGRWCSQCGQAAIDYRRSFRHVIVDVLDAFLNWDSKFLATIGWLIVRPWHLTNEFLAGRRRRYFHPLRLYLLASILFFFAVTFWVKSVRMEQINLSPEQRAEIENELEREKVAPEVREKVEQALGGVSLSPENRAQMEAQLKREDLQKGERARIEQKLEGAASMGGQTNWIARAKMEEAMKDLPPEARAKVDQALKQPLDGQGKSKLFETDGNAPSNSFEKWIETRAKEKFGEHGTNIQLFLVTLISNLPYMMLVCIPLFAFVLKILYLRRRVFYIDHLVYALHIHTFAYLAIMLIVLITIGLNRTAPGVLAGWIIGLLWSIFAVQIFLSIRRVYRQSWFFTIFKFFAGGFIYLIVLLVALGATFLVTLWRD